jgi:trehalose 6-phosphate synthase
VDRLDYTKGLPQKFRAFGRFLEKYPDYRRKVILSQIAPPTRETVAAYADIRRELETLSGRINGRYGELDWVPIQYIHRSTPRKMLVDVFRNSRIGFVTPLRDGMNLVAKEYVAAQDPDDPGVLILSRFAGAAEQMQEALIVNPYDVEEMAKSIKVALDMGLTERQERHGALLEGVRRHNTYVWCRSFLNALESVGRRNLLAIPTSPSDAARKALQEIELARVSPRMTPN